ncbi:MAG: cyclic nucleotide-binding domain-containing protein [Spirochaetes bacterium]|nr:cyclic nucleotide-binding domain-containing protein [Spirochaetota bacterium]
MIKKTEVLERLKTISLFKDFIDDINRLNKVINYLKFEKYKSGSIIINEGELGNKLFILHSGTVRILKKTLNNDKYTVTLLSDKNNIFFGEIALIDSDKRSATVAAETDCIVFSFDRNNFIQLCEVDSLMAYKITLQIAKKISISLRKMNEDVVTLFEALVNEVKGY